MARAALVQEFLESEKKYVQDLEVLQNYRQTLHAREVLQLDQIQALFENHSSLLVFQRIFLAAVESNVELPADEQRFGLLFTSLEHGFSCYEPFCANFSSASQFIQDENAILSLAADILEPKYEVSMFLMKPYARLFKYSLFLQQLLENSDPSGSHYGELPGGFASITRVIHSVNQAIWKRENDLAVNELRDQVVDWKGYDVNQFGGLLLRDTVPVIKKGIEREYHVYLFERIILFFKQIPVELDKKTKKGLKNIKQNPQISNPMQYVGKFKNKFELKGRIFIANLLWAKRIPGSPRQPYLLQAKWRGDATEENFALKCRTAEHLNKWQAAINAAVDEITERRPRLIGSEPTHCYNSPPEMSETLTRFPSTIEVEMEEANNLAGYSVIVGIQPPSYGLFSGENDGSSAHSRTLVDEEEDYQMSCENTRSSYFQILSQLNPSHRIRFGRRMFLCG